MKQKQAAAHTDSHEQWNQNNIEKWKRKMLTGASGAPIKKQI